jgi:hypothetical protein
MLNFFPGSEVFAVAGAVAAAGPILIHLLNRRRYKVVAWAAMDFVRKALTRNRRILQWRDLLLLILRTACVLLFGLGMSRPFFSSGGDVRDARQPVHAILLLDNSLSMDYSRLEGSLLDLAKREAIGFVDRLPEGSRVTVLPVCGSSLPFSRDGLRDMGEVREAINRIEVVDRSAPLTVAVDLAAEALQTVPELPVKRVVLFGDQQAGNWPAGESKSAGTASTTGATPTGEPKSSGGLSELLARVPDLQVVRVAADDPTNTWVADLAVPDDLADTETPAQIVATIRHEGAEPRAGVPVSLKIDGVEVASQTVDLEPGQSREVRFLHQFSAATEGGQVAFVAAEVSLPPDRLAIDDARHVMVPVVASVPVVFIDQFGAEENPAQQKYGESLPLRRLLSPVLSPELEQDTDRKRSRHLRIGEVTREALAGARLVVVAGVDDPEDSVPVLREFVEQGGSLFLSAGAGFDPALWQERGWLDGAGILPLPLDSEPSGKLPNEVVGTLEPMFLDPESLKAEDFLVADASREEMADLYRTPLFFKVVVAKHDPAVLDALLKSDTERLTERGRLLAELESTRADLERRQSLGTLTAAETREYEAVQARIEGLAPKWLAWSAGAYGTGGGGLPARTSTDPVTPEESARRAQPVVIARLTNGLPYLVERRIGEGLVVMSTSGLQSAWNTLARTNAILLFDRLLRSRMAGTFAERTLEARAELVLPVAASDRRLEFLLERPRDPGLAPLGPSAPIDDEDASENAAVEASTRPSAEPVAVDALGSEQYGLTLRHLLQRGVYRVVALRPETAEGAAEGGAGDRTAWESRFAINGTDAESRLETLTATTSEGLLAGTSAVWREPGETITVAGARVSGEDLWKWLMGLVLVLLLLELAVIALPELARSKWWPGASARTSRGGVAGSPSAGDPLMVGASRSGGAR